MRKGEAWRGYGWQGMEMKRSCSAPTFLLEGGGYILEGVCTILFYSVGSGQTSRYPNTERE